MSLSKISFLFKMLTILVVYIALSIRSASSKIIVNIPHSEENQRTNDEYQLFTTNPSDSAEARNYLYLNYKEAYGIRYDPKHIRKKYSPHMNIPNDMHEHGSDESTQTHSTTSVSTSAEPPNDATSEFSTTENSLMNTSESFATMTEASIVTTTGMFDTIDTMTSTQTSTTSRPLHKYPVLAFPLLVNRPSLSNKNNSTNDMHATSSTSSLRNTLSLIKKRIKQWFTNGIDLKAPLVNGQRFLNVFNVIKFENAPCTSTQKGLTEMSGICYHDYQCSQMGGISVDECADGLGVCCIFKVECGQKTDQMTTYFQNPGWPEASQDRIICTLTLELQPDVSQVLIEFLLFELKAPTDGNCVDDQFFVAGQNLNNQVPTICGVNSGQHMYVNVDNAMNGKIFLSILTKDPAARGYNIRVTQLRDSLAPSNCLQYFTDTEGWIQTFNYDDTSKFVSVRNPSYFNNLNYAICIERQWNYCSVTYSNEVDDVEYDFQMINVDSEGVSVIPQKQAGVEIFSCNDDFISVNSIRLCGEKLNDASRIDDLTLNSVVTDTGNGPNYLPIRTNDAYVGRGFRINYKQIPCEEHAIEETTEEIIGEEGVLSSRF